MITVTKNNQGYWLNFDSEKSHASIHIETKLLHGNRGIIEQAIIKVCEEDCVADNSSKETA